MYFVKDGETYTVNSCQYLHRMYQKKICISYEFLSTKVLIPGYFSAVLRVICKLLFEAGLETTALAQKHKLSFAANKNKVSALFCLKFIQYTCIKKIIIFLPIPSEYMRKITKVWHMILQHVCNFKCQNIHRQNMLTFFHTSHREMLELKVQLFEACYFNPFLPGNQ